MKLLTRMKIAVVAAACALATSLSAASYSLTIDGSGRLTGYTGTLPASLILPDSVITIDGDALSSSTLKNVTIPASVESISPYAFEGVQDFVVVDDNSYYCAKDGVLFSKDGTQLVAYPDGRSATSYKIPGGVTSIAAYAISGSASLTSVVVPTTLGVNGISPWAFDDCKIQTLSVADGNGSDALLKSVDGVLFSADGTVLVKCPAGKSGTYVIPDGVTEIASGAFNRCELLTSVTIPEGVTTIGDFAFEKCELLSSMTLPSSLEGLGTGWGCAFMNCTKLTQIFVSKDCATKFEDPRGCHKFVVINAGQRVVCHYETIEGRVGQELRKPNGDHYFDVDLFDFDTAPVQGYGDSEMSGYSGSIPGVDDPLSAYKKNVDENPSNKEGKDSPSWYHPNGTWYNGSGWSVYTGPYHPIVTTPTTAGTYNFSMTFKWNDGYTESINIKFIIQEKEQSQLVYSDITYDNLKGATHSNPATYQEGTVVSFNPPSEVVGYTFAGWTPSAITADMTGPQTVTANWMPNTYTIKYDANGGEGTTEATACTYDEESEVAANGFTRTGYQFSGWAIEEDGVVVYTSGEKVSNLVSTAGGSMTLYAVWSKIEKSGVTISDLKVTPISPLGLAIDYTVSGVSTLEASEGPTVQAKAVVNGAIYVAKTLSGATNCVNGAHRVYWNMAADGITVDANDGEVSVSYGDSVPSSVKLSSPLYCVIDLEAGANAESYSVEYLDAEPTDGFNTTEYKTTKLVLKRVDAGTFVMGEYQTNEAHRVTLTKPFYMGLFEVTRKQYELVMGTCPRFFGGTPTDEHAVGFVTYNDIRGASEGAKWPSSSAVDTTSFLGKLRMRTGIEFDLPTSAQWEFVCRASTTTAYSFGDELNSEYVWTDGGIVNAVGKKKPNPWGFYDMHGNASEWCLDLYGQLTFGCDPRGASSGARRVFRSLLSFAERSKSYLEAGTEPSSASPYSGFRLARTLPGVRVVADNSDFSSERMDVSYAMDAIVKIDGKDVMSSATVCGTLTWWANPKGKHSLEYSTGGISLSATYNVRDAYSQIFYENLKGATHENPVKYKAGTSVEFSSPAEVPYWKFTGWTPSAITSDMTGDQTIKATWSLETVPTPVVSSYDMSSSQKGVTLYCGLTDAKIYYTTNGVQPSVSGECMYSGMFSVSRTTMVWAIAVCEGIQSESAKTVLSFDDALISAEGGTSFTIPGEWFATYYPDVSTSERQKIAEGAGVKTDASGAAMSVWQDYVAGTDPTNALSKFTAKIEMKDGAPVVTWSPTLNGEGVREGVRVYRVWGKADLDDAAWSEVEAGGEADFRFFRVTVEMP